jgi:hypothetical protein
MNDQITPGMVQTILRSIKVTTEAITKIPPLLGRIAAALEARPDARASADDWGKYVPVYAYECGERNTCRICQQAIGDAHLPTCRYALERRT